MPVESLEAAKTLVENWVNDRGYPISPSAQSDDFSFQFSRISPVGIAFVVLQPKNLKRAIVVATRVDLQPFHIKALDAMKPQDRDSFWWNLKMALLSMTPGFFMSDPSNPKSIEFSMEISFDELTEGKLHDAVDQTTRCVLYIIWSINKKFGPLPQPSQEE